MNKKGKTLNYYLAANDVSKAFHQNVCKEAKKVRATGTVKKVDSKNEFTVSKIELANQAFSHTAHAIESPHAGMGSPDCGHLLAPAFRLG